MHTTRPGDVYKRQVLDRGVADLGALVGHQLHHRAVQRIARIVRCRAALDLSLIHIFPQAERQFLAGVSAQYDSEVVYHSIREDLEKQGVLFSDCDTGLREHEELFRKYFGTVIPPNDNKFAALNSAVWSGGSFVYVPKGVKVDIPLQAYFRINSDNMGQFERTLIIADEGSSVHYICLLYTSRCV